MVVGIKDAAKLIGISIIACCAVLVCTLFLNFNMDIGGIEKEITSDANDDIYIMLRYLRRRLFAGLAEAVC